MVSLVEVSCEKPSLQLSVVLSAALDIGMCGRTEVLYLCSPRALGEGLERRQPACHHQPHVLCLLCLRSLRVSSPNRNPLTPYPQCSRHCCFQSSIVLFNPASVLTATIGGSFSLLPTGMAVVIRRFFQDTSCAFEQS